MIDVAAIGGLRRQSKAAAFDVLMFYIAAASHYSGVQAYGLVSRRTDRGE